MILDHTKYFTRHEYQIGFKGGRGLKGLKVSGAVDGGKVGSLESLVKMFERRTKKNGEDDLSHYLWGLTLVHLRKYGEAKEKFQEAVRIQPDYFEAYYYWGRVCHELGEYEECVEQIVKALDIRPSSYEGLFYYGVGLYELGRYEEAIDEFKLCEEVCGDGEVYYNLGLCYDRLGEYGKAKLSYEKANGLKGWDGGVYLNWGNSLYWNGEYEEAIEKYKKGVNREGEVRGGVYLDGLFNMGASEYRLGRYEEAIELYERVLEKNPLDGEALNNIGASLCGLKRYGKGVQAYEKAILIGDDDRVYNNWGVALEGMGEDEEAGRVYEEGLGLGAGNGVLLRNYSLLQLKRGRYEEAKRMCERSIELEESGDGYNHLGVIYVWLQEDGKALENYRRAIEYFGDDLGVYGNWELVLSRGGNFESDWDRELGDGLYRLGEYGRAIRSYERWRGKEEGKGEGKRELEEGVLKKLGRSYYEVKEYAKAIEVYSEGLRGIEVNWYRGRSYYEVGEYGKAIEDFEEVKEGGNEVGKGWEWGGVDFELGNAYYGLGEYERSIELYEDGLAKGDCDELLIQLGNAYQKVGNFEKAKEKYLAGLKKNWDNGYGHSQLGEILVGFEEYESAFEHFNCAVRLEGGAVNYYRMGYCLKKLGKYREGINYLNESLSKGGIGSEVYVELGEAYQGVRNYRGAIDAYEKAIELEPDNWELYCNLGIVYQKMKKDEEAVKQFDLAIVIGGGGYRLYRLLGISYLNLGRYEKADRNLEFAVQGLGMGEGCEDLFFLWGLVKYHLRIWEGAIEKLSQHITRGKGDEKAYYYIGLSYYEIGRYQDSERNLRQCISFGRKGWEVSYYLGLSLKGLGKYGESLEYLKDCLEEGQGVRGVMEMGDIYELMGSYEEAINCYERVLNVDRADGKVCIKLGQVLMKSERTDEAIEYFRRASELNQYEALPYMKWGDLLLKMGSYEEAIEKYEVAGEYDRGNVEVLMNWGLGLLEVGKYREGLKKFDEVLRLEGLRDGDRGKVYHWMGRGEYYLKNYEEAKKRFLEGFGLGVESYEGYKYLGKTEVKLGDYRLGVEAIEKAIEKGVGFGGSVWMDYYDLGYGYYRLGEYEKAIENLKTYLLGEEGLGVEKKEEVHALLGLCYKGLRDVKNLVEHFSKAIYYGEKSSSSKDFYVAGRAFQEMKDLFLELEQEKDEDLKKGRLNDIPKVLEVVYHELGGSVGRIQKVLEGVGKYFEEYQKMIEQMRMELDLDEDQKMRYGDLLRRLGGVRLVENIRGGIKELEDDLLESLERVLRIYGDQSKSGMELRGVDINQLIGYLVDRLEREGESKGLKIEKRLNEIPVITGDQEKLEEILESILDNAYEAIEKNDLKGGIIEVKTEKVDKDLFITIEDNGVGIDSGIQNKIFDPFFTTKLGGLGISLYLAKKFIEEHHGTISYRSEKGVGSIFMINFPL